MWEGGDLGADLRRDRTTLAQYCTSFAAWSWDRTAGKAPYRTAGDLTEIATAPRMILGQGTSQERGELKSELAHPAIHWGVFGQRTRNSSSGFRGFYSPRVCLI